MSTRLFRIDKGLDVPISGAPKQEIEDGPDVSSVALLGGDYVGMKPTMLVQPGDSVKLGQPVFEDKKTPGVLFTAPGAGKVREVVRGPKRRFDAMIIDLEGDDEETFPSYEGKYLPGLSQEEVRESLIKSGLWTALRTRPYGKTPAIDSSPHSIFVTCIDTNPLAAQPFTAMEEPDWERYFVHGVQVLTTLTEGSVFVCRSAGKRLPDFDVERVEVVAFDGPHPAGLVGTHIHYLAPVSGLRTVWHLGYQDVVAIGRLFLTGKLSTERVISLAGPLVKEPRLIRTRLGASLDDLTRGQLAETKTEKKPKANAGFETEEKEDEVEQLRSRIVSGSVLSGRQVAGSLSYLSRFDLQVTVLAEGGHRELLGWALPGAEKFSLSRAFASAFLGKPKPSPMTTTSNGSHRAIVPIGLYEKVMPLDIIPTALLKALMVQDTETAQSLGCLELDEEDLALCTFVCPSKNEYGPLLRQSLTTIEIEG